MYIDRIVEEGTTIGTTVEEGATIDTTALVY
jgi:hypothetical protein